MEWFVVGTDAAGFSVFKRFEGTREAESWIAIQLESRAVVDLRRLAVIHGREVELKVVRAPKIDDSEG